MNRRSLAERLLDNARHQREVIEFISLCGPDHHNHPKYLAQLREYRAQRLDLYAALAGVPPLRLEPAAPANIPFPIRRSA